MENTIQSRTSLIIFSESPTNGEYTWAPLIEINASPQVDATALANEVLAQPGGPNRRTPRGEGMPRRLKTSPYFKGHSVA